MKLSNTGILSSHFLWYINILARIINRFITGLQFSIPNIIFITSQSSVIMFFGPHIGPELSLELEKLYIPKINEANSPLLDYRKYIFDILYTHFCEEIISRKDLMQNYYLKPLYEG